MSIPLSNIINDWIPNGSKVIDFGCGDGSLLKKFNRFKKYSWIWC
jgi:2-polyprenyl-3-methyl-5-hydroxy-6-metoxy-1,4-benzoquinol methylase